MLRKKIEFYVIDGYKVAREAGMGSRINTIMQTCFFAISGVLPREEAIEQIKKSIKKTYGKRGDAVVQKNFAAVDHALAHLEKVELAASATSSFDLTGAFSSKAPKFVHDVLGQIAEGKGDLLSQSARFRRAALSPPAPRSGRSATSHIHSGVDKEPVHPVRQVRHRVPARGNPREDLRRQTGGQIAGDHQVGQTEVARHGRPALHAAGGS